MKSLFVLAVCMMLCVLPVQGEDAVCASLRSIHDLYGDALLAYLSEAGESCLAPTQFPVVGFAEDAVFSESGSGFRQSSVDLEFAPGIYRFNILHISRPIDVKSAALPSILFYDIVDAPSGCFPGYEIKFPAQVSIETDCRVFATFSTYAIWATENESWNVTVTEYMPTADAINAESWVAVGKGRSFAFFDIVFRPGIYRIEIAESFENSFSKVAVEETISDPSNCFPRSKLDVPSQVRISEECRVYGLLNANLYQEALDEEWTVSITKLH